MSDDQGDNQVVNLESSDGVEFSISRQAAQLSGTIDHILSDLSRSVEAQASAIPLSTIPSGVLEKVIDYMNHLLVSKDGNNNGGYNLKFSGFDEEYVREMDMGLLFDVILAANFLDVKPLLELGLKTVARMAVGRTPQEVTKIYSMPH
eukprot:TRINITY_DN3267_c0_g1_i1.p1 TRINITY_DN3267_c0_g1~~TRINITY_DN3267_c0_g1_i1.p1  ORF type:complete len:148 (-),score=55.79 TRINITY_DN3267_c0_g1_i1:45-488(-)